MASPLPDTASDGSMARIASSALALRPSSRKVTITAAGLDRHVLDADLLLAQLARTESDRLVSRSFSTEKSAPAGMRRPSGRARIDAALLIPARQVVEHRGRQHVGQREQRRQRRGFDDGNGLPARRLSIPAFYATLCGYFLPPPTGCPAGFCARAPARRRQHRLVVRNHLAPRTDSPRVTMSVMVCLMMRTCTPSASSTYSSLSGR